jgi:hypothetical protein
MALIKITTDGREFELNDDIAGNNEKLREALSPFYPELANADIDRELVDGVWIVKVTKRAGTKGAGNSTVIFALAAAPEEINPALVLQHRIMQIEAHGKLSLGKILRLQPEIRQTAEKGMAQVKELNDSLRLLEGGKPVAGRSIPPGF